MLARQPFRIALVEALGAGAGEGVEGGEGILRQLAAPESSEMTPDRAEAAATARPSAAEPGVTLARTRSAISEPWLTPPTLVAEATSSGATEAT